MDEGRGQMDREGSGGVSRRRFLAGAAGGLGALGLGFGAGRTASADERPRPGAPRLRFPEGRPFKIVQFNDTQDDEQTDRRTVELIEKVLDAEKPDFVVNNGDVITGGCENWWQVKQAINNVVRPMESRGIPWAVTYGNHDEDSGPAVGMDEADMLRVYQSYDHNLNADNIRGVTGTSNTLLEIAGGGRGRSAFALWLIDSGRYAPDTIAGQDFEGYPTWDWIRMDTVDWYRGESVALERRNRGKVPALMFFHIPLWEHRFMWWGGVDGRTAADAERGVRRHGIVGERNEDECPGPFNSGMFSAILERGDVEGVFCGHDHVNTYVGDYYGVQLGYAGNTGFGTYGMAGAERNRLRGARVFELAEDGDGGVDFASRYLLASEYGIDLAANDQPMEPAPLAPAQRAVRLNN